jgi:hypothetical protein
LEREVLGLAVRGHSDLEISDVLSISGAAVKKRWERIYEQVNDVAPDLVPGFRREADGKRGPEKRSKLLRYIAAHPEELTPYRLSSDV